MVQSMCLACPKPMIHGLVQTVTLTCLSTHKCYHLPRVSRSNNLPWVSPSNNLPRVSLFPNMPGASLYITLTIRDNQSLTMLGASLSRHKPDNSWLHTDNLSTSLHLSICHTNNRLHMDNHSDCHTNSWLHTDNRSTYLHS
jgi:hypothetical protein